MKRLAILGSTGSIGTNTLSVVELHPDKFSVTALAAHKNVDALFKQCLRWRPRWVAMSDPASCNKLKTRLKEAGLACQVSSGPAALDQIASSSDVDAVMAAVVGSAGLSSTLAAARAGKQVMLANKEALVMAGVLLTQAVRDNGSVLLPVDSEHNAIFQALPRGFDGNFERHGVRRLWLTASGGPFLRFDANRLASVTPDQACAHPKWVMGRKISVDSATLMNKGLEVIEASFLFQAQRRNIEVVIHPQSIVHSLVEYVDGSVLAQMGNPDMRTPIAHVLNYPERIHAGVEPLDLFSMGALNFERPDVKKFPCLRLACEALDAGGSAPIALNAANEVAVARFLEGGLAFPAIAEVVERVLDRLVNRQVHTLDDVIDADASARRASHDCFESLVH
ncbi:MAG: 1-deoxy-D-xylulose-5-phosphate reductoisomerase [Burkholderiales bacterium]